MKVLRSAVRGVGGYLPDRVVGNAELATLVDTSDSWIQERTGIRERRRMGEDQAVSDMAVEASKQALYRAGRSVADLDLIIVATTTPDLTFPATAAIVQRKLGAPVGVAFDVQAVCSGFVYALSVADGFVARGLSKCALVIGAEAMSRLMDWTDRGTCVLFGDGAGAVLLQDQKVMPGGAGILSTHLHSDGRLAELLYVDGAVGQADKPGHLVMNGREVFRHAVNLLSAAVNEALSANGLKSKDIDWLVPHQANRRIIDGVGKKLGLPAERVVVTVDRHANTSAASIPLALAEAINDGRIIAGQLILLEALGGGLTWGSALIRM